MPQSAVAVCHTPAKMHEKLESLAPMHIQRGVRAADMPSMGRVVFAVLHKALGDEFTVDMQEAWGWVWAWLTKSMTLTLENACGQGSLVSMSWDICMDNYTEEDLGGMLYDTLFEIAPSLKSLFSRPRPVMAMKLIEMVTMLVSFSDDEARMTEQINWLGSKHVKYGAKPHHVPILGQMLVGVLERAVGDEWTEEMTAAWNDLWTVSCGKMMAAISAAETYGHVIESLWEK
jgi:hemoglobin-like flavoprotein